MFSILYYIYAKNKENMIPAYIFVILELKKVSTPKADGKIIYSDSFW